MRDYKRTINLSSTEAILNKAYELDLVVETMDGALNDTYLIHNTDKRLTIKGVKPRAYILLGYTYRNSQSNDLYLLMSDKESIATDFYKQLEFSNSEE